MDFPVSRLSREVFVFSAQFKRRRHPALMGAILLFAACGDDHSTAPPQGGTTIEVVVPAAAAYPGDVVTVTAIVRDSLGHVIAGAPITWSVNDPTRAELGDGGIITLLKSGPVAITARSNGVSMSRTITVRSLTVQTVTIGSGVLALNRGDVIPFGVRVQGQGGRDVFGRSVQFSVDHPSIATVDASGRLRAIAPGVTTLRATADGVTGTARVEVDADNAVLNLSKHNGTALPVMLHADTVMWNGEREYHEVWLEGGQLSLTGDLTPRYTVSVRYVEYAVRIVNGQRQSSIRLAYSANDRGLVNFDARGDLQMTSEIIYPLSHTAMPVSGGFEVKYRIAGSDEYYNLFYRREPR
jgi:hypothetical protein